MANIRPSVDSSSCWFCNYNNISYTKICCKCNAQTIPTSCAGQKTTYRIFSFGSRTSKFPSSQKLHASLLDEAVQTLTEETQVAVRVGHNESYAILIKDMDGKIRSALDKNKRSALAQADQIARFLEVGRNILLEDPDQDSGARVIPY